MGAVEQSTGEIESYLSSLEESYGSFSINQRTVSVSAEQFAHEHARNDVVEVYAKVRNGAGEVLHVEEDGTQTLPSTTVPFEESLEPTVKEAVTNKAGISCQIQDLEQVTILGLHNDDSGESETLYRLAVLFDATEEAGDGTERAVWKENEQASHTLLA